MIILILGEITKDYTLNTSGAIIMVISLAMVLCLSGFCIYKLLWNKEKQDN